MESVPVIPPAPLTQQDQAPARDQAQAKDPLETISHLAYSYWEARGGQGGDALSDWARAEEEYRNSL